MSAFAGKQNQAEKNKFSDIARARKTTFGPGVFAHTNAVLHLQSTIGNRAVLRMLQSRKQDPDYDLSHTTPIPFDHDFSQIPVDAKTPLTIQPKLAIGAPGNQYEREADHVADQVISIPEEQSQSTSDNGSAMRDNPEHPDEPMQTKAVQPTDSAESDVPPVVHKALNSSGQPLDAATRAFMEPRFGHDFSRVRTHADSNADQSNRALRARAFTYGRDIFFRQGEYDLGSLKGRELLAHELHHTLQQQGNPASHQIQRQSDGGDDPLRFLKARTAQADKTSTAGYMPSIIKEPFLKQKTATSKEELSLLDNFLAFLGKLDRKVNSLKGDATQKVGMQVYGTQSSNKDSPGAKPAKNFIDLGRVDFKELNDYFDLLLTTMGERMPTNTRQAMKSAREKFDKWEEIKDDPQKIAELIYETAEKIEKIKETREEEERSKEREKEQAKSVASSSGEPLKTEKATKIYDGRGKNLTFKYPVEFTVPAQGGKQETMTRWWQIYVKATDGSGLFRLTLNWATFTFEISTFGDELYSSEGLPAEQIFNHYPRGYKYIFVGDPGLLRLLPSH